MLILKSAKEEITRSPVAAISGAVGVLIASASLLLAWIQFQSPAIANTSTGPTVKHEVGFNISNLLLVVAHFLSLTVTTAITLRAIARKHDLVAFFGSIPALALSNFSTIIIIYLAPPREFSQAAFTSAHDLVFYGATIITITFCGKAVARDIVSPASKPQKDENQNNKTENSQVLGGLILAVIVMVGWGKLIFAGQVRLTTTLLPEITHPIEQPPPSAQSQKSEPPH